MKLPFFSIVIPTYNRASLLKNCLESVLAQTYSNWEAIIVDNYSEDNTEEVVASFNEPRFRYIKNHNYGVIAVSRNKAIEMANGDWVCFLDSDDQWQPTKLREVVNYTSDYDLIYHDFSFVGGRRLFFQHKGSSFYEIKEPTVSYVLQRGDPVSPSCAAVRRSVIGDTRFDESKALFAIEDYDFFLQIVAKSPRVKKINQYLAYYNTQTGVSHNRAELDRLRRVYAKYRNNVTDGEFIEMLKLYMARKGSCLCREGDYRKAKRYYSIAAQSHIWANKRAALKAVILCLVYIVLGRSK